MKISGLQKLTLLDYPGKIACTIFTKGCNFRCPFCHNSELVIDPMYDEIDPYNYIGEFLDKRKNELEGVCITGGEPTIHKDLPEYIKFIKDKGFLVKLDTNGSNADMIKYLLDNQLIDYIAMDIKAGNNNYLEATEMDQAMSNIMPNIARSISLIKSSNIDYEFRTTVVNGIHTSEDFFSIKGMICGAKKYYLQCYKNSENVLNPDGLSEPSADELKKYADIVKDCVGEVGIRGIDIQ